MDLKKVREPVLGPCLAEDVERLEEAVVAGQAASPDAELQAPFGNMVDGRDILGQPKRVLSGRTWTAIPILTRCVHAARVEATMSGAASTDRSFWKWISASHTVSKPKSSATFICASDSSNAAASVTPGGLWNSVNRDRKSVV